MENNELAEHIFRYGTFMMLIDHYNMTVCLYAMDSDFFEVGYDRSVNEIERVGRIDDLDLQKYLNRIELIL